jgi:alpha-beta hydrolase superfamily lysophospholipase
MLRCQAKTMTIYMEFMLQHVLLTCLCIAGHSLGGAIALLCTLDLLHSLGDEPNPNVTCVGFATPAVGNAALAEYVKNKGWQKYITNYLVPGQSLIVLCAVPQHIIHNSASEYSLKTCIETVAATLHLHDVTSHLEEHF